MILRVAPAHLTTKGEARVVFGDLMRVCTCKSRFSNGDPKTLIASEWGSKGGFETYSSRRFFLVKNVKSTFVLRNPKLTISTHTASKISPCGTRSTPSVFDGSEFLIGFGPLQNPTPQIGYPYVFVHGVPQIDPYLPPGQV